jgi:hypothetical protein
MLPTPNKPFAAKGLANTGAAPTGQTALALTAAVQTLTLPVPAVEGGCLRIVADGGTGLAWCLGVNAALTIDNGAFLLPNTFDTWEIPNGFTQISVIGASAAGKIRVHFGEGF